MAKRGRKPSRPAGKLSPAELRPEDLEPCSELSEAAEAEFRRLAEALHGTGTLGRVDLAVLTEAARVKELLDRAHKVADVADAATIKVLNLLTTQRRGLLRELGLTLQPSRSVVRTNGPGVQSDAEEDPIRKHLKISG